MLPLSKLPEKMPSAASMFSAYASVAASMMLMRSMANDLIPDAVKSYLESAFRHLFAAGTSRLTVVIDDHCGMCRNQIYEAAEVYLRTKISPSTERFKVGKTSRQKTFHVSIERGEEVTDTFQTHLLTWKFVFVEPNNHSNEKQYFELTFDKKIRDRVLQDYLPFVLNRAKEIKDGEKVVRLYTRDIGSYDHDGDGQGCWGSVNLEHPSTFDTLAVDPELKKTIIDDLDRFLKRKDFYKKVGKAWKRGYLLYGPPGTGKSSLIAAMANYLKFDIYDLELSSLYCNSELRRILVDTNNKSIIVIEDIDCCGGMLDRDLEADQSSNSKVTLSGLLNFIDGLWSCCGDERIIIFTTNHKNRLDPALLRPGRMDMHICMSYLTFPGFRVLASNYLGINDHHTLFGEIKSLIENVNVTPAEVAEQLMKDEDADAALAGVVSFLKRKQVEAKEREEEASKAQIQAPQEEAIEATNE